MGLSAGNNINNKNNVSNISQAPSCCVNGTEIQIGKEFNQIFQGDISHGNIKIPILKGNYIMLNFGQITRPVLIE